MANNYTEFSFSIPLATTAECEWVETLLADPPAELRPDWCEPEDECLDLEFDWAIEVEDGEQKLVIFSQDGEGNTDKVEEFLKIFLAKSPTKLRKLGAEFSYRCDRPRVGQFGGSAVFVHVANDGSIVSEWMSTGDWLQNELKD